jgi:hypothetical protein
VADQANKRRTTRDKPTAKPKPAPAPEPEPIAKPSSQVDGHKQETAPPD